MDERLRLQDVGFHLSRRAAERRGKVHRQRLGREQSGQYRVFGVESQLASCEGGDPRYRIDAVLLHVAPFDEYSFVLRCDFCAPGAD